MSYLKQYEYVIAVYEHGGISQAAQSLGISQPTFSKYLKKLEGELGVELFDRSTLPIKLTAAGECYVRAGKQFIDLNNQLSKQLQEIKSSQSSVVKVGISPSRSPYMMPEIVAGYRKKHTQGSVIIKEGTTEQLSKALLCGELDMIISLLDKETQSFKSVPLFDERIMLAVPTSLYESGSTAKDVLATKPLISVGKGQAMWQKLSEITEEMGIDRAQIECQSIESALALVKRGIGAMLVPSYIAMAEKGQGVIFLELDSSSKYERRVCLFYRNEQFLTQAEKDFIECVLDKKEN